MKRAVIVRAKRTPIGKENGMLKEWRAHELAAPLVQFLAEGMEDQIADVIIGNVTGPGGNIGRLTALEAGMPLHVPGFMLDRQCSAGLEAIRLACYLIQGGASSCYIAGGVESTSTSPFERRAQFAPKRIGDPDMVEAAEHVAQKYGISKAQQDEYALLSYQRSWDAFDKGYYDQEVLPVGQELIDEAFHKKRNLEALLRRSKPLTHREGTVTAANSCGIHDGAAAVLIMEEEAAREAGLKPVLRFVDSEVAGVHPFFPGAAPIPAMRKLLSRNSLTFEDIDLVEINEAFASKIVACEQELGIPFEKLNVSGGALTTGHPYGASGAILTTRLFYEVQRRPKVKYVLAAIGSGGGVGLAVLFEVIDGVRHH